MGKRKGKQDNDGNFGGNMSKEQKNALIEFMSANPQLVSGKYTAIFTQKHAQKLWEDAAQMLNSIPGGNKDWDQWRKSWHDTKRNVKKKTAFYNTEVKKTGGGPLVARNISTVEDTVAKLIGTATINGDPTIQESQVAFVFETESSPPFPHCLMDVCTNSLLEEESEQVEMAPVDNELSFQTPTSSKKAYNYLLHGVKASQVKGSAKNISPMSSHTFQQPQWLANNSESKLKESMINELPMSSEAHQQPQLSLKKNSSDETSEPDLLLEANSSSKVKEPVVNERPVRNEPIRRKRYAASTRFNETLNYTKVLSENVSAELQMKSDYYKRKLELLERDVIAKERIAAGIEQLNSRFNRDIIEYVTE